MRSLASLGSNNSNNSGGRGSLQHSRKGRGARPAAGTGISKDIRIGDRKSLVARQSTDTDADADVDVSMRRESRAVAWFEGKGIEAYEMGDLRVGGGGGMGD